MAAVAPVATAAALPPLPTPRSAALPPLPTPRSLAVSWCPGPSLIAHAFWKCLWPVERPASPDTARPLRAFCALALPPSLPGFLVLLWRSVLCGVCHPQTHALESPECSARLGLLLTSPDSPAVVRLAVATRVRFPPGTAATSLERGSDALLAGADGQRRAGRAETGSICGIDVTET